VGICHFHIRDDFGVVGDMDVIELPDVVALLAEGKRSATELTLEGTPHHGIRFEVADASSQTVLVTSVQQSLPLGAGYPNRPMRSYLRSNCEPSEAGTSPLPDRPCSSV
jgi:hypothetical protein